VHVDAALAALVLDEVGQSALAGRHDDGSVVLHLEVTNIAALRSWLFELGDHAEVIGPDAVRADVVAWLEAVAAS
jgi:predicted DNA-binding transcriptional regulator YafY